jgi:hypothetical protein
VNRLKVGEAEVDLHYRRRAGTTRVDILDVRGDLTVVRRRSWPEPAAETVEVPAV